MDFITHLPSSLGKTSIMVVVDRLSKYSHFITLPPSFTAESVAKAFVKEIVKLHGFPQAIVSDRDTIFMSAFWQELFRLQGTLLSTSSAYHPQSDGQTKVVNRCLEDYLRCFVANQQGLWVEYLPWAEFSYNTAWHSSIQMTPFQAVYGRPPPTILSHNEGTSKMEAIDNSLSKRTELLALLKKNITRAQHRMKQLADAHRSNKEFAPQLWVYVKLQHYRQNSL